MALPLQLQHPSKSQLVKLFHRYFYALDADDEIQRTSIMCSQCVAMKHFPRPIEDCTTANDALSLGLHFACDIMHGTHQCIFVLRDSFSSYTITTLIPDKQKATLKTTLMSTTAELKAPSGCTVLVDGASLFSSLVDDEDLQTSKIRLEVARAQNRNKNPVVEKDI